MTRDRPPDDLLTPTLSDHTGRRHYFPRPWSLDGQFLVAFFGGPLAASAVGFLNGRRLRLGALRLVAIAATGVVFLAAASVGVALGDAGDTTARVVERGSGVACYLATRALQAAGDRGYRIQAAAGDDEYESLLGPGVLIALVGALVTAGIVRTAAA